MVLHSTAEKYFETKSILYRSIKALYIHGGHGANYRPHFNETPEKGTITKMVKLFIVVRFLVAFRIYLYFMPFFVSVV